MSTKSSPSAQTDLGLPKPQTNDGPVECLGMTFESDEARRAYFTERLREKLQDPEFRKIPGFPKGSDEAILRLSDPPYYTACPNPFLAEFVRAYGRPYNPEIPYAREPFAVDVSVGKTDQLYKAHGYHTKVPHLAIVPSILHYTNPGDVVLDGFCGSGMTGVAVDWCENAPGSYKQRLEMRWRSEGLGRPTWGRRFAVLGDLAPAATLISATNNLGFDVSLFEATAGKILDEVRNEFGWMFSTSHDGREVDVNYVVWSEVFSCPECGREVTFVDEALDPETKKVVQPFPCPHCGTSVKKRSLERRLETVMDPATGAPRQRIKLVPVAINYTIRRKRLERPLNNDDKRKIQQAEGLPLPQELPTTKFPIETMYHGSRIEPKGFSRIHHMYHARVAQIISKMWNEANRIEEPRLHAALKYWLDSHLVNLSVQNRYRPEVSFPYNPLSGVYYIGSAIAEANPFVAYENKLKRIVAAFSHSSARTQTRPSVAITTGHCGHIPVAKNSVDYIFTDPPFGENIYYADLNFLVESWHGVRTDPANEAIVDRAKKKGVHEYQDLMRRCFLEYFRVLKPGRWMTVVFSNSSNGIWRAIQEAMGVAGFVVADVRTLDKKHGSYRQVTSSAVKQDLIISAYKPTAALEDSFELGHATADSAWAFVREHLHNAPVFVGRANEGEVVVERTPQMLLDRMIAFHVQRGVAVPLSGPEFMEGLAQRFPERDGMYFLPDQVAVYDRKRTTVGELRQLSLFVNDEASAIQWVRQQLHDKPQSFQDLQPQFMRELQAWAKHEQTVELKDILDQNFLHYDGQGPVPSQIHSYLSSNFKELRNLEKDDARLVEKAADRWYVPDPNKQADVELKRSRELLKEFEEYKTTKQRRLKVFRTEAVRAGFKSAWQARDYDTIIKVAEKLPPKVLQEDDKMLMYYDNSLTRLGDQ